MRTIKTRSLSVFSLSLVFFSAMLLLMPSTVPVSADDNATSIFIQGTVTTDSGDPVAGASIVIKPVLTSDMDASYGINAFKSFTTQTLDDGTYQIWIEAYFPLYKITVNKEEYRPASSTLNTKGVTGIEKDFILQLLTYTQEDIWVYAQFGEFEVDESKGEISGEYVSFIIQNGTILSYSIKDRVLFDVAYSNGLFTSIKATKSHLKITGEDYVITVYDTPTGFIDISTNNTISFSFGGTYELAQEETFINVSTVGMSAVITHDTTHAEEFIIENTTDGAIVTTTGQAMFFLKNLDEEHERWLIDSAIQEGLIGAEITVHLGENGIYENQVMTYSNVDVDANVTQGEILLLVSGDENTLGKTIVINADNKTFYLFSELNMTYDGESIPLADDIFDVLNPNDDGVKPEWYLGRGATGTQILISIPHFSTHTIKIFGAELTPEIFIQYVMLALFLGIFIVIIATLGMFRRD
ncbi:hypothetical protein MBGDN05_00159 [Thermoplasmatales archaeon SCGC AB-539-N05]|nr:hypothetical protein MBGDN05_00159 [Thermoplasmatales archaeon SCGC AB-539-N05]